MLETEDDIVHPPTSEAVRLLLRLREAGEPITLTINGTAELEVKDDTSFDRLVDLADRLDLAKTLRERLESSESISLEEAKERVRQKYGYAL